LDIRHQRRAELLVGFMLPRPEALFRHRPCSETAMCVLLPTAFPPIFSSGIIMMTATLNRTRQATFALLAEIGAVSGNCLRSGYRWNNFRQRLYKRNAAVIRLVDPGAEAFFLEIAHHSEQDEVLCPQECA
jgi:hypothetical protein